MSEHPSIHDLRVAICMLSFAKGGSAEAICALRDIADATCAGEVPEHKRADVIAACSSALRRFAEDRVIEWAMQRDLLV